MHTPTDEQDHAIDTFRAGHHLVLQAGAGTGKTSTLGLLAACTQLCGRYLAFNKDIARDAAARFPRTVACKTAHATAYAVVGHRYTSRLNSPRQPAWKTGRALDITRAGRRWRSRNQPQSALPHRVAHRDPILRRPHPCPPPRAHLRGLNAGAHAQLADVALPFAAKAWTDLHNPDQGLCASNTTTT